MEELRSTEILDKEIRIDTGKKAESIKAKALKEAQALKDSLSFRIEEAKKASEKALEERLEVFKKNTESALPLEKRRYALSYVYSSVIEGLNSYFDSLGEKKRLLLVKNMAEKVKDLCKDKKMTAFVYVFNIEETSKMLKSLLKTSFTGAAEGRLSDLDSESLSGFNYHEGVILKAEDSSVTCRLTLDQMVKELLDSHALKLSLALFGGRLPE